MAQCRSTPQEFIKNSFTPQVAVICSPKAEEVCKRNNLTFKELLHPFCKLGTAVHYKDPTGNVVSMQNLKITLQDINYRPPQPVLARKFLNSSVSEAPEPRFYSVAVGEYNLMTPINAPWFDSWRDTFFQVQFPSDHEFTKHFIACMLVISTSDDNPNRMMVDLSQKVNDLQTSPKLPKWFSHNVLRYYVILHEKHDPNNIHAVECYDNLKMQYGGNNVFLLRMNSRKTLQPDEHLPDPWSQYLINKIESDNVTPEYSPTSSRTSEELTMVQEINENGNSPTYHPLSPNQDQPSAELSDDNVSGTFCDVAKSVVHGALLTVEDIEQLKLLVHEFCTKALLPFVERQISNLNEFVTNKKGVSRSFISATKRWFSNKPGAGPGPANTPSYYLDAPELQVRRLGDLYFMFGHYSMAYQAYHTAKGDFNADQAWLHYAGALEMAALSAFMANEMNKKTIDYMEESITTYLNTCKLAQFATRATLLSAECLKGKQMYGEAAHQLIRMTCEESDLRSALLLEQAAYCFLSSTRPPMVRKYAFHMVLAGHRFSKATQRKHSLRCYKQAFQVYENKGWNLAQDHIQYTIGRLANNLNLLEESVQSYAKLLSDQNRQSAQQQAMFLKEYLTIYSVLNKSDDSKTQILPLPLLDSSLLKVLVGPAVPLRTPGKVPAMGVSLSNKEDAAQSARWAKLEEMLVQEAQGSLPMIFKPLVTLFTQSNCTVGNPIAILGEPIQVAVQLTNPLQILLLLKDVYLLWEFRDGNGEVTANESTCETNHVKTYFLKSVVLNPVTKEEIPLMLVPLSIGELSLKGICYSLVSSSSPEDQIEIKGKQLFKMNEIGIKNYKGIDCNDKRLNIKVVPVSSCLEVTFGEINFVMLKNELQQVPVELRNVGSVPLHKIYLATSTPELISFCEFAKGTRDFSERAEIESTAVREREARKNHVTNVPLPQSELEPGQCKQFNIWIRGSETPSYIDLLVYYENVDQSSTPRYRLVRHVWNFQVHDSLKVDVTAHHSHRTDSVEQLTFSMRTVNMNKIHYPIFSQVTVLSAAMLSDRWTLFGDASHNDKVELGPQDSAHITLNAKRKTAAGYSIVKFSNEGPTTSDRAYLDFAKRIDQFRVNIFNDLDDYNKKKHERKNGTILLRWQAKITDTKGVERLIYGQNQVAIDLAKIEEEEGGGYKGPVVFYDGRVGDNSVVKTYKEQEELTSKQQLIKYNIIHSQKIVHDFKSKKLCVIQVKLLLHNTSEKILEVVVKTLETSSPFVGTPRQVLFTPHSSRHCRWIKAGVSTKTLKPLHSDAVDLSLAVLEPGTYDLGSHLEVWCYEIDKPETVTLQTYRIQSSVIVTAQI